WLMMSLWDALRMNMMISYQELVRTFPKTVNSYRYRMFSKLNIHGDVELTHLAIRHGLCNAESLASQ
ncbi:LuxR C-terminal-related transcriptional regulator, partial [Klebsiella pneumoniae]|uniref:LuxR C-terminal-related transcriptional regulator n=1 Tax=Klebsiella pneumoniae TaxID=573 RepID=UPI0021B188F5